jgi:hypothetical protein
VTCGVSDGVAEFIIAPLPSRKCLHHAADRPSIGGRVCSDFGAPDDSSLSLRGCTAEANGGDGCASAFQRGSLTKRGTVSTALGEATNEAAEPVWFSRQTRAIRGFSARREDRLVAATSARTTRAVGRYGIRVRSGPKHLACAPEVVSRPVVLAAQKPVSSDFNAEELGLSVLGTSGQERRLLLAYPLGELRTRVGAKL